MALSRPFMNYLLLNWLRFQKKHKPASLHQQQWLINWRWVSPCKKGALMHNLKIISARRWQLLRKTEQANFKQGNFRFRSSKWMASNGHSILCYIKPKWQNCRTPVTFAFTWYLQVNRPLSAIGAWTATSGARELNCFPMNAKMRRAMLACSTVSTDCRNRSSGTPDARRRHGGMV